MSSLREMAMLFRPNNQSDETLTIKEAPIVVVGEAAAVAALSFFLISMEIQVVMERAMVVVMERVMVVVMEMATVVAMEMVADVVVGDVEDVEETKHRTTVMAAARDEANIYYYYCCCCYNPE